MKPVLFASTKPLDRAENMSAVFHAYQGRKVHLQVDPWRRHPAIECGDFDLMVIDEYPTETPGKAILLWHAIDGGKTVGLLQPRPYFHASQSGLITRVVTSGTGTVDLVSRQDGVPVEAVMPLGTPRTDAYIGKRKGDGHTPLAGKRSYLYVPTYRSGDEPPIPSIDWDWLDRNMTDDELFVVKPHMMTKGILDRQRKHIREIPSSEPSAPYLYDCDVVVTDYSSIIFDGYLLGKPGILFEKRRGYVETRGMSMTYPDRYCSRYCTNEEELLHLCRSATDLTGVERNCLRTVADRCDGHATERVCRLIEEMAGGVA